MPKRPVSPACTSENTKGDNTSFSVDVNLKYKLNTSPLVPTVVTSGTPLLMVIVPPAEVDHTLLYTVPDVSRPAGEQKATL
jgi:hypothetical protein